MPDRRICDYIGVPGPAERHLTECLCEPRAAFCPVQSALADREAGVARCTCELGADIVAKSGRHFRVATVEWLARRELTGKAGDLAWQAWRRVISETRLAPVEAAEQLNEPSRSIVLRALEAARAYAGDIYAQGVCPNEYQRRASESVGGEQ